MKGVIFNLLETVVTDAHGADMWDDLIDAAGVDGVYTSLGNYPDGEMEALLGAAATRTGLSRAQALRWFGQQAMPHLKRLYPKLFEGHESSQSFVLSVNEIIHPEVRKLYPDASCPFFHMSRETETSVAMRYESERTLFDLAQGFVEGAANIYGDAVSIRRDGCGDEAPRMTVTWTR